MDPSVAQLEALFATATARMAGPDKVQVTTLCRHNHSLARLRRVAPGGNNAIRCHPMHQSLDGQAFQFSKHRGNQLTYRRVYMHGPPDDRVRSVRVHDIKKGVHDFVGIQTEERSSQNLAGILRDDDLHEALTLA